eukprot:SAG22_NODE_364_length_11652_cov_5.071497_5_plen_207_part_00
MTVVKNTDSGWNSPPTYGWANTDKSCKCRYFLDLASPAVIVRDTLLTRKYRRSDDNILALGMKPFVELSFLPQFVANCSAGTNRLGVTNPDGTAANPSCGGWFAYDALDSPWRLPADGDNASKTPASFRKWHDLVHAFAAHVVARYGIDEVATWQFEVSAPCLIRSALPPTSLLTNRPDTLSWHSLPAAPRRAAHAGLERDVGDLM